MEKQRIYLYDNLKFLLMVFVVIGHFIDYGNAAYATDFCLGVYVFIYAFHMPLFFFLSGLFFSDRQMTEKVFFYLSTGMVMGAVNYVFQRLLYGTGTLDYANVSGVYWFIVTLAVFTLMTHYLKRLHAPTVLAVSVIVACFAGYSDSIGTLFGLSRIAVFFPFYFAGTMIMPEKAAAFFDKKALRAAGTAIAVVWGVICAVFFDKVYTLRKLFTGVHPYAHLLFGMRETGGLYRLLCYGIAALLCFAFLALVPNRRIGVITAAGARTLQVYFWHLPVIFIIHTIDRGAWLSYTPFGLLAALLLCIGTVLLLSLKPFSFPTALLRRLIFTRKNEKIAKNC